MLAITLLGLHMVADHGEVTTPMVKGEEQPKSKCLKDA